LYSLYYEYLTSDLVELREWTAKTNVIIAEVEAAVSQGLRAHDERVAEDARLRAEAEKQFGNIPDRLLSAFGGNKATTLAFMQKVAKLRRGRLDEHIVCNCGRARRRDHLVEVSGDQEFFLGADPNEVSWYVADVHLHRYYEESSAIMPPLPQQTMSAKEGTATLDALANKWGARRK
jgi:hypothetical protein